MNNNNNNNNNNNDDDDDDDDDNNNNNSNSSNNNNSSSNNNNNNDIRRISYSWCVPTLSWIILATTSLACTSIVQIVIIFCLSRALSSPSSSVIRLFSWLI
ncbi:hypothetical protein PoB_000626300 [Plakobranchus ocellatus]|uniref:Uncharacterized protein n=1 Tax=Plakobranchus ocellatus TaxID=259542 RepID=A0AAV3YB88_9GAST|nr:hypothetical protein PoB_000626300 [Plakobranchus ocellatus]